MIKMRALVILLVVLSIENLVSANKPGPIPYSRQAALRTTCTPENNKKWICVDSENMVFCDGPSSGPKISCASLHPSRPHCNREMNNCTSWSGAPTELIHCMENGFWPHPLTCKKYLQCFGGIPYVDECTYEGQNYDHNTHECSTDVPCVSFSPVDGLCKNAKEDEVVAYTPDRNVFTICTKNQAPMVLSCPKNYQIDTENVSCEFVCSRVGKFKHAYDKTKYFYCRMEPGNGLVKYEYTCPKGLQFCERRKLCIFKPTTSSPPTTVLPDTTAPTELTTYPTTTTVSITETTEETTTQA